MGGSLQDGEGVSGDDGDGDGSGVVGVEGRVVDVVVGA